MTCDKEVHERFDLVYARFLLTHLPEPPTALASMVKLLRPGGIVAVEDIDIAVSSAPNRRRRSIATASGTRLPTAPVAGTRRSGGGCRECSSRPASRTSR